MKETLLQPSSELVRILKKESDQQAAIIKNLQSQVQILTEQLEWFRRQFYGSKSERVVDVPPNQPSLEGLLEQLEQPPPAKDIDPPATGGKDRKKRKKRGEGDDGITFPDDLPVVDRIHELPEQERICPVTGEPMQVIGYDYSHKLAIKPRQFYIIRHVLPRYASANHPESGVIGTPMPPVPIDRCSVDVTVLVTFLISKYLDHLPLNRISQIFARSGVHIHRKTMSAWAMQLANLMRVIYDEMKKQVLESPCLFIDETTVKEQKKGKCKTQYVWVAASGGGSDPPYRIYHYGNRSHDELDKFIDNYQGNVHSDQYAVYVKKAREGQFAWQPCGAHLRRKFVEASPDAFSEGFHGAIIRDFRNIFRLERVAWNRDPEQRLDIRRRLEAPIIERIAESCRGELIRKHHLPKSKSRKALEYLLNAEPYIRTFLDNPDMRFDNNVAERALRPLAIGRKNWIFVGKGRGGDALAIMTSILQTCKSCGVNPWDYLIDVLPRIQDHNSNRIAELLPDRWAEEQRQKVEEKTGQKTG